MPSDNSVRRKTYSKTGALLLQAKEHLEEVRWKKLTEQLLPQDLTRKYALTTPFELLACEVKTIYLGFVCARGLLCKHNSESEELPQ